MYCFRLTKYDPKFRKDDGSFLKEDWTEYSDIGKVFNGSTLTKKEYLEIEDSYLTILRSVLEEDGIFYLRIVELEYHGEGESPFKDGQALSGNELFDLFRKVLRYEDVWAKFEGEGGVYVHFGGDMYVYVGCKKTPSLSMTQARDLNLYIEKFQSPYFE